jgi:hypothetical protein
LAFFGLNLSHSDIALKRVNIFTKIHEMVFWGNNYSYETIYNFPLWLRDFTFNKLKEHHQPKENENPMNDELKSKLKENHQIKVPDYVVPNYLPKKSTS